MTSRLSDLSRSDTRDATVKVWDVFVRVSHWTVAVGFFVAYFTEDDLLTLHVWAGYTIGVFVALRIVWGFIGPRHARFSDFLYSPLEVWRYLVDLVAFRATRYLGHSPAGGAMTFALLIGLAATVWAGLELYAIEEHAGPLAAFSKEAPPVREQNSALPGDDGRDGPRDGRVDESEEFWEEVHEVLANVMLVLVILHIGGVILASVVHGENLAKAMVTGRKRPQ